MKKNIHILFFTICLLPLHLIVNAQTPKVKWGATVSDEKDTKFNIIGEDENSVYVMRFQHDHRNYSVPFFVVLNRNTLQETKSVEMQIPVPDDGDAAINQ